MRVPIAPTLYANLLIDIVEVDVPFLLGLDALDALALYINNVDNRLKCDKRGTSTPLVRKHGHIYLDWANDAHYSMSELERLHRHFNHPAADRLTAVLRRTADPKAEPDTQKKVERLTAACDVCQRLARAPGRFRVAIPDEDVVFNRTVLLDLMYLDGRSVLHVVDKDTLYSAATLCSGEAIEDLWTLYLETWVHAYVGHPQIMHVDQAPQFKAPAWKALADSANTALVLSGIESHNALGVGERYHAFLRLIYRKVRLAHPGVTQRGALSMATAAMNQTAGPRGLVPTLLVFGVIPRMPVTPLPLPAQRDRLEAMVTARKEMATRVASLRVRTALAARVPAAADRDIAPAMRVLVYREPPVDKWEGPFVAVSVKDKTVHLAVDGQLKPFGIDKVKPYLPPVAPDPAPAVDADVGDAGPPADGGDRAPAGGDGGGSAAAGDANADAGNTQPPPTGQRGDPPPVPADTAEGPPLGPADVANSPTAGGNGNPDYGQMLNAVIAGERFLSAFRGASTAFVSKMAKPKAVSAPSVGGQRRKGPRARTRNPAVAGVAATARSSAPAQAHITVVIPPGDPRIATERFKAATRKEVDGLRNRGTFRKVKLKDVPAGANIIGGRIIHTLKNVGTKDEGVKARFVAQGHRDKAKDFVVHNLSTLRHRSIRVLVSTAANLGMRLFAHDITQAYLQSEDRYSRRIYLRPRPADRQYFVLEEDELLLLLRPLYGVVDAGDYWNATITNHVEGDLVMRALTSDPALYVKWGSDGSVVGLLAAYVDDLFMAGNKKFQTETEATLRRFEAKLREYDKMEFVGVSVDTDAGNAHSFSLGQPIYVDRLTTLPADATFKAFSSARASAAWLGHTRPDLSCGINKLAQVSEGGFEADAVRDYNKLVRRAKDGRDQALRYLPLDTNTLQMRTYADASFAGNRDLSSQVGYVVLLCDASGRSHVLAYSSRKCKRVVRSAMAGEVYALTAAMDEAFVLRYDLETLYRRHIPLTIYTDSKQSFDVITRSTHPTEKRLLIDIAGLRESYTRREISSLGLVATEHNIADGMTKLKCGSALDCLLKTGIDATPVVQWIVRPAVGPPCPTTGEGGSVNH
eukprot:TRINITY_DN895_c0_g1_i6.p1 TRINITY_DN895_c0_g1~~TRINITY_DN895_c0_g1_i6.p1  ORF type:complete len:1091 (+),score=259.84 TRINITY_DN895_c0_g1_i6:1132-4404(+)